MVNVPATLPTTTLDTGTAYVVDLKPLLQSPATRFAATGALPAGLSFKSFATGATTIQGTTTAPGTYPLTLTGKDDGGDPTEQVEALTLHVVVPGYANVPAAAAVTVPPGEPVVIALQPLRTQDKTATWKVTGELPPGLAMGPNATTCTYLYGTPTTGGTWTLQLAGMDARYGTATGDAAAMTITVGAAVTVIPAPAAAETEDGYMLPEVEGVRWLVDGAETAPGSYSVQPVTKTTTVTIVPEPLDGWKLDPAAVPLVLTFEPAPAPDPDPDPEPEPEPGPGDETTWARLLDDDPQALYVATRLADRIVRHVGQDVAELDPTEVLTARDHAMVVLEYVKGYTRDRGFVGYIPHRSLQAVIVAAAARLFTNPEQLTYYSTGDYSERPATLTGWTAAELGVLRRFRRIYR